MTGITPVYGIRYPDSTTKLKELGGELAQMGGDFERAMQTAGIPPVSNPQIIAAPSAAARDAYWGTPTTEATRLALQAKGAQTVRTDKGWTEQYYATYNAGTNPQGALPAGWYQTNGGGISFFGSILTNTALAGTQPIGYSTIVEDTHSAWSASNKRWTCPVGRKYMVTTSIKQTSSASFGLILRKNGEPIAYTGNAQAVSFSGTQIAIPLTLKPGDYIDVTPDSDVTSQSDAPAHNTYLTIASL